MQFSLSHYLVKRATSFVGSGIAIIVSAGLTAFFQSSSVVIGITMILSGQGFINIEFASIHLDNQIANAHTIYNIIFSLAVLPILQWYDKTYNK